MRPQSVIAHSLDRMERPTKHWKASKMRLARKSLTLTLMLALALTATLAETLSVTHASTEAELELYGDIYIQSEFESLSQTRQRQHLCQRELP